MSEQRSDTVRRMMLVVLGVIGSAGIAGAQVASMGRDDPATAFYSWSLLSSPPPEPTIFKVHDLITIIVNENSQQESEETLKTEKDFSIRAELSAFLDVSELLTGTLLNGIGGRLDIIEALAQKEFEGDGAYERRDRIIDRITAEVIDVKPNGVLVLEAIRRVQLDEEKTIMVLSGMCDAASVTEQKTILSTQLANLTLSVQHDGPVHEAASKGWLTRAIETIFPF